MVQEKVKVIAFISHSPDASSVYVSIVHDELTESITIPVDETYAANVTAMWKLINSWAKDHGATHVHDDESDPTEWPIDEILPKHPDIVAEMARYSLGVKEDITLAVGHDEVHVITLDGVLYNNEHLRKIWNGYDGFTGMESAMHGDMYNLAPETTSIVVVDPGGNYVEQVSHILVVFSAGG